VVGDSKLVIEHATGGWVVKEEKLKPYVEYLLKKMEAFEKITLTHIGRTNNRIPDALANLASAWEDLSRLPKKPFIITSGGTPCYQECYVNRIEEEDEPWYHDLKRFMEEGTFSRDANKADRTTLRKMATRYVLAGGTLYIRSWEGMLLRCISAKEGSDVMKKVHEGVCGAHLSRKALARKIMRQGYFGVSMERDCIAYVRRCIECQAHDGKSHLPAMELHPTANSWPFPAWE